MINFSDISFDDFKEKIQSILHDSIVYTDVNGKIYIDTNYFLDKNNEVHYYESTKSWSKSIYYWFSW